MASANQLCTAVETHIAAVGAADAGALAALYATDDRLYDPADGQPLMAAPQSPVISRACRANPATRRS